MEAAPCSHTSCNGPLHNTTCSWLGKGDGRWTVNLNSSPVLSGRTHVEIPRQSAADKHRVLSSEAKMGMGSIQPRCEGSSVDVKQDRPGNSWFLQHCSGGAEEQSCQRYHKEQRMQLPNVSTHQPKFFAGRSPLPVRYEVQISVEAFLDPRKVSSNFVIIVAGGRCA